MSWLFDDCGIGVVVVGFFGGVCWRYCLGLLWDLFFGFVLGSCLWCDGSWFSVCFLILCISLVVVDYLCV